jgi:hypothetical protein
VPLHGLRIVRFGQLGEIAAAGEFLELQQLFLAALLYEACSRDPMFFAVLPELLPGLRLRFAAFLQGYSPFFNIADTPPSLQAQHICALK